MLAKRLNDPRSNGSIRSLKGRKCRFDLWEPDSFQAHKAMPRDQALVEYGSTTRLKRAYTYKALNRLIQASAADQTKQSMVNLYKEGIIPLLQVHDELAFSVKSKEQAQAYADIMINAVKLEVPNKVDTSMDRDWETTE